MSENNFISTPFAVGGDRKPIPENMQTNGSISYEGGYGFDYERDPETDPEAKDIDRETFNELMYQISSSIRQFQTMGVYPFLTAEQNGGKPFPYAKSARCLYDAGKGLEIFESLLDNNNIALPSDKSKWRAVYDQWAIKSKNDVLEVIKKADITPSITDPLQLYEAIQYLIKAATPDKYDVAQYYWFEDELMRPGMLPCLGGLVQNVSNYAQILKYLSTSYGQKRLVTQAEYDALHVATWHTCADGSKIGWEGVGGVNKFVWDPEADTLRLPDLAGMTPEMIGCDGLGVGGGGGGSMGMG